MVVTPVKAYFSAKQFVALEIQVPQALKLYKALHDHTPKNHEVFMKEIIKDNHIKLPELPENHSYLYGP